jgi:hypothetical protein
MLLIQATPLELIVGLGFHAQPLCSSMIMVIKLVTTIDPIGCGRAWKTLPYNIHLDVS